jgi:hypothetical protein
VGLRVGSRAIRSHPGSVQREQDRRAAAEAAAVEEKRRAINEWLGTLPPVTDEDRAEIQRIMDDMYDEDGLPK